MELRYENGLANGGWLFDRVNGMFREVDRASRHLVPAAEVIEDKDAYHFYFEMPGIKADSVNVQVEDGRLMIEAVRKQPEWPKDAEVHLSERSYGTLRRSFTMPEDASAEGIKATYRDGVLEVMVPNPWKVAPKLLVNNPLRRIPPFIAMIPLFSKGAFVSPPNIIWLPPSTTSVPPWLICNALPAGLTNRKIPSPPAAELVDRIVPRFPN